MLRRTLLVILTFSIVIAFTQRQANACPFCKDQRGPTLLEELKRASMVLVGSFTNPQPNGSGLDNGTTDFVIEQVLKAHPILKDGKGIRTIKVKGKTKKVLIIPRLINNNETYILFCDVYKGDIDPYKGEVLQEGGRVDQYLADLSTLKDKSVSRRLQECFKYLNDPEYLVSLDAYREFAKADYKDYQKIAEKLPAKTIAGWLKDKKTPAYRYGLYGSLIGHCGEQKHIKLLRKMIDDRKVRRSSGIDGLLAGYLMLQHKHKKTKEALGYLNSVMSNKEERFMFRYATLRTIRFFWTTRPDVFEKKSLAQSLAALLEHDDMADFAIDDLRKWKQWQYSDEILGLWKRSSHNIPVVKKAILRFAIRGEKYNKACKSFITEQRQTNLKQVQQVEKLLEFEDAAFPTS
ncbi:MAG: hypothetical protein ACFCD0_07590 [Gemmataceae bacterium]